MTIKDRSIADSSVEDYRRELERQVAGKRDGAAAAGARRARAASEDPGAPSTRAAAAVGRQQREEGMAGAHEGPLQRLADAGEAPSARLSALQVLKLLAIASPTAAAWRPQFFSVLRAAVEEPELRAAALEVLAHHRDRPTQERLLAGLSQPDEAIVPPEQALRLLGGDPHADAHAVARRLADEPPSEAARMQALKVLASDPESTERFRDLLADATQGTEVRKLAATALNSLAPEVLRSAAAPAARRRSAAAAEAAGAPELEAGAESAVDSAADAEVATHVAALLRARR